jgi:RNA polymerase sigma-70 factor (ECF subfamily)
MTNRALLDRLYREHGPAVLRRARQILQDEEEARDALQEIFLSLADHPTFEQRGGTTAWFYTRTTHFCLNRLRDNKNRARLRLERGEQLPISAPARGENVVLARDVLTHLPPELAEVAIYYHCDEMTQDEIAALMACSRRHVGHLLERLHDTMRIPRCG